MQFDIFLFRLVFYNYVIWKTIRKADVKTNLISLAQLHTAEFKSQNKYYNLDYRKLEVGKDQIVLSEKSRVYIL